MASYTSRSALAVLSIFGLWSMACSESSPVNTLPPIDTGCTSDLSCAEGQVCSGGMCVTGQCNVQRGCPAGELCDTATFTCSGSANNRCTDNSQCPVGFCINGACQDVQCVMDSDCAMGMRCDLNRCVTLAGCMDADGDGYGTNCTAGPDCDDSNGMINPGQVESGERLCGDGIDNDCNGADAICQAEDVDGDGFAEKDGDCNDMDPNVNPGQTEVYYNGVDEDCNPMTNDADRDGDGFAAEQVGGPDCDDMNPNITPIAEDIPGNGVDEDCDGMDRVLSNMDGDGDGVTEQEGDCNDNNPNISPDATEIPYNSVDDDCDVNTRDNDLDGDGFGIPRDCDDEDPNINPNAMEIYYNGVDEDCNPSTLDADADGDGVNSVDFGGADCNDEVATVNPNATEIEYNGVDDDCNPNTPDDDLDGDGVPRAEDCNDEDANVSPNIVESATSPNCGDGIDNNCVGGDVDCDANAEDDDGDGIPNDQDCAPNNPDIPGPFEISNNGLDDDCDANTPDSCEDDVFDSGLSNATPAQASAVVPHTSVNNSQYDLTLCPGDEDWYQIRVNSGDGIEVDVIFLDAEGDIDVRLYRQNGANLVPTELTQIASSTSGTDNETVYQARANATDSYFIRVYHYGLDRSLKQDYEMAVRVFEDCTDDALTTTGEQNDSQDAASSMPDPSDYRQICSYDNDWYRFSTNRAGQVRIDALFKHDDGDIDIGLYNEFGSLVTGGSSASVSDNEAITISNLAAGEYFVKVYGHLDAQNRYKLFKSSGNLTTARDEDNADYAIEDGTSAINPGVFESEPLNFGAIPANAIIRSLTVKELDINHGCLNDLKVELLWDGQVIKTLWNRQGDQCLDGGLDDDSVNPLSPCAGGYYANRFTRIGNDLCLQDRNYTEFGGLDAQGDFTVRISDFVNGDTGELVNLDIEIEYFLP